MEKRIRRIGYGLECTHGEGIELQSGVDWEKVHLEGSGRPLLILDKTPQGSVYLRIGKDISVI